MIKNPTQQLATAVTDNDVASIRRLPAANPGILQAGGAGDYLLRRNDIEEYLRSIGAKA